MKNFKLWLEAKRMVLWDDEAGKPVSPKEANNYRKLSSYVDKYGGATRLSDLEPLNHGYKDGDYVHKDELKQHFNHIKRINKAHQRVADAKHQLNLAHLQNNQEFKYILNNILTVPLRQLIKNIAWWHDRKTGYEAAALIIKSVPQFKKVDSDIDKGRDIDHSGVEIPVSKMSKVAWNNMIELLEDVGSINQSIDSIDSSQQTITLYQDED